MRQENTGQTGSPDNQESPILLPRESAEAIKRQRIKRKSRELCQRMTDIEVHMEIRRVNVGSGGEPASRAAKIKRSEQIHEGGGCEDHKETDDVVRRSGLEAQDIPDFSQVIKQRGVEQE